MKKITFFFVAFIFCIQGQAQQNIGLHFADIWQQNNTNPAFFPDEKVSIGLGSIYSNTIFRGATLSEIIQSENGNSVIDIDAAIAGMDAENSFDQYLSIQTLNLGLKFGKIGLSLSHALKFDGRYDYPKTFPQLAFQGNAQFIDETVEIGSTVDFTTYNELAVGLAYLGENFNIGGRVKYLAGVGNARTNPDRNSATIYTDPDIYQLTLTADYELESAGFIDYQGIDSVSLDFAPSASDISLGGGNSGVAFDLGAQVKFGKLTVSASILDIGSITWSENAKSYSTQGTFTYDGLDITNALSGEGVDFANALDTLEQIFEVKEESREFTTNLAPQFYLSGQYELSDKLTLGALLYRRFKENNARTAVAGSAQYKLGKLLTIGGTYAVIDDSFTNIGLNASAKLGPVQIYALTDNILGIVNSDEEEIVNLRAGLNVVF